MQIFRELEEFRTVFGPLTIHKQRFFTALRSVRNDKNMDS